ncbi:MAG TPA: 4Fe-4S binding protein [Spirochaetota bacterium]|nr:4Fe-4S binding protein [Spirochaetota bacterium]HOR45601.1 4Fe-4S binding protein [Spirochaetota bacterium]HPK57423.1 4Fe-4S binding protein [Spirochaetota bacterium]HQE58732.1 4Fe-4S binding protein [Spirochaetota bacterium]
MFYIKVDSELCKGCLLCLSECPKGLIKPGKNFNSKGWLVVNAEAEGCTGCRKCVTVCPDLAIKLYREN